MDAEHIANGAPAPLSRACFRSPGSTVTITPTVSRKDNDTSQNSANFFAEAFPVIKKETSPLNLTSINQNPILKKEESIKIEDSDMTDIPEAPPTKSASRVCGVCETQPAKYKCPRCILPYCSVACSRSHKENHPPTPEPSEPVAPPSITIKQEPSSPFDVLLDHRDDITYLFTKHPHLESALLTVLDRTNPPKEGTTIAATGATGMLIKSTSCYTKKHPWTKAEGLRHGAEALRKARTDPSETGDGVREFCELVSYLLATPPKVGVSKEAKQEKVTATGLVHDEIVAEDEDVIRHLIHAEGFSP